MSPKYYRFSQLFSNIQVHIEFKLCFQFKISALTAMLQNGGIQSLIRTSPLVAMLKMAKAPLHIQCQLAHILKVQRSYQYTKWRKALIHIYKVRLA